MRNIAPFATLIALVAFFSLASPSFATLDNLANILTQISVTGIMAVGIDLRHPLRRDRSQRRERRQRDRHRGRLFHLAGRLA
jgi:hypothetical protein